MIFGFCRLSSVKKIRRRTSFDPYPPDIVKYRNLRPPYPPKNVRRLLWTAPKAICKKNGWKAIFMNQSLDETVLQP